ncbi:hypothetical protein E2C01_021154 [Portunus trituberculatus]|uniref:Uncharacterized protein n=1 Tax=Portunus trituberculatus TaxID=210409 RepID=A0A5B7E1W1_PORTR|nr:hypothetical protein [Portunus trituberculatus]
MPVTQLETHAPSPFVSIRGVPSVPSLRGTPGGTKTPKRAEERPPDTRHHRQPLHLAPATRGTKGNLSGVRGSKGEARCPGVRLMVVGRDVIKGQVGRYR